MPLPEGMSAQPFHLAAGGLFSHSKRMTGHWHGYRYRIVTVTTTTHYHNGVVVSVDVETTEDLYYP
jgi:hypothetical protein